MLWKLIAASNTFIFLNGIAISIMSCFSYGADEPPKGIFIGIGLESHNASAQYPDLQWIGSALEFDSIGGEQPIRNYHAGDIGLAVSGRLGHRLRTEPSFNVLIGFGGGTKPTMHDTSVFIRGYRPPPTDTMFHTTQDGSSYLRRLYGRERYVGVNLAADLGVRAGVPFTVGSWTLMPLVGIRANMLLTSASEHFCGSYYWIVLPIGVSVLHAKGDRWSVGGELFAEPVVGGAANWAFNLIIVGDEGEFVNLGTPVGFSGCLKFCRSGKRGALELSPYVTYFHHERSNVAGSNIRWWWNNTDYGGNEKWFEPAGSTLRIGIRAGCFFSLGRKHREAVTEEDDEQDREDEEDDDDSEEEVNGDDNDSDEDDDDDGENDD